MRKFVVLFLAVMLGVGCGANSDDETVSDEAAKAAQSRFETGGPGAVDNASPKGGAEGSQAQADN